VRMDGHAEVADAERDLARASPAEPRGRASSHVNRRQESTPPARASAGAEIV
jgi:hypothetical protein